MYILDASFPTLGSARIAVVVRFPSEPVLTDARASALYDLSHRIAKIPGAAGGETTGGHILGTPRYVAPEQIIGGRVDARTDVYAAGLVLFEMIAGRGPYEADDTGGLLRAHVHARPRRLAELRRVSSALDHAVARARSKRPDRRWPSARAFAEVLSRAVASDVREEASR